jgi:hypothetical protein
MENAPKKLEIFVMGKMVRHDIFDQLQTEHSLCAQKVEKSVFDQLQMAFQQLELEKGQLKNELDQLKTEKERKTPGIAPLVAINNSLKVDQPVDRAHQKPPCRPTGRCELEYEGTGRLVCYCTVCTVLIPYQPH